MEKRDIHGIKGKGFFTFYGGHDPEDYTHRVGDPKTELDLHPTSPGYRLILNNVLFPYQFQLNYIPIIQLHARKSKKLKYYIIKHKKPTQMSGLFVFKRILYNKAEALI